MDQRVKGQEIRGQVRTTISEVSQFELSFIEKISVVAVSKLALLHFNVFFGLFVSEPTF